MKYRTVFNKSKLNYDDLSKDQQLFFNKYIYNGVGTQDVSFKWWNWIFSIFTDPADLIFTEPARRHDFAYWRGGSKIKDRLGDDMNFMINSVLLSLKWRQLETLLNPIYFIIAILYSIALFLFGWFAYEPYETKNFEIVKLRWKERKCPTGMTWKKFCKQMKNLIKK